MGRLGSPRAQALATTPVAPQPSALEPADEREPETNGEELFLCLVEAVKDLPIRTKIALGKAMVSSGPRYAQLSEDVKDAYEAAAELVWSDDDDEDEEDEDEEGEGEGEG